MHTHTDAGARRGRKRTLVQPNACCMDCCHGNGVQTGKAAEPQRVVSDGISNNSRALSRLWAPAGRERGRHALAEGTKGCGGEATASGPLPFGPPLTFRNWIQRPPLSQGADRPMAGRQQRLRGSLVAIGTLRVVVGCALLPVGMPHWRYRGSVS
jgi:hypothetical protein